MKSLTKVLFGALTATALGAAAKQGLATRPGAATESTALQNQVAELQVRLAALESRVESMNKAKYQKVAP